MKKTLKDKKIEVQEGDLLPEYEFDYSKAKPNRFASRILKGMRIIVLDSDVAKVFKTNESVNATLRSVMNEKHRSKRKTAVAS